MSQLLLKYCSRITITFNVGLDDFSAEDCSGELVWCERWSELSQLSSGLETPAWPSPAAAACPASEKPCCVLAVILGHPAQYKTSHRQHPHHSNAITISFWKLNFQSLDNRLSYKLIRSTPDYILYITYLSKEHAGLVTSFHVDIWRHNATKYPSLHTIPASARYLPPHRWPELT